jgi:UDP-2,3-diacylglucosamine hydrolase
MNGAALSTIRHPHLRSTHSGRAGCVVSDLHLYTHRTSIDRYVERIGNAAGGADFFVLNGDIFDFSWTTLASVAETVGAAERLLEQMAGDYPRCQFFYVLGNHDGYRFFAERLDEVAARVANFHWHPSHLRIGDALFLHGDLALDVRCRDPFHRSLRRRSRKRGSLLNLGYQMVIASGVHRVVSSWHRREHCARRILRCVRQHHPRLARGIRDVYFGHIHRSFRDFVHDGVTFHNTGAAIRGLHCEVLSVRT